MDLPYLPYFGQCSNALARDWNFPWSIKIFLNGNRCGITRVDNAFIILNGNKSATLIKDTPVSFDQSGKPRTLLGGQMGEVKFILQALAMVRLREGIIKFGIILV